MVNIVKALIQGREQFEEGQAPSVLAALRGGLSAEEAKYRRLAAMLDASLGRKTDDK